MSQRQNSPGAWQRYPLLHLINERSEKLLERMSQRLWLQKDVLAVHGSKILEHPISVKEAKRLRYKPVREGEVFGPAGGGWNQRWFHCEIPPAAQNDKRFLIWQCQGEHVVYFKNEPWCGLDVWHSNCPLPQEGGTLWIDSGTYQTCLFGPGAAHKEPDRFGFRFEGAWLGMRDEQAWNDYWDYRVLHETLNAIIAEDKVFEKHPLRNCEQIDLCPPLIRKILHHLNAACDAWDESNSGEFRRLIEKIYKQFPAEKWQPEITFVGHSHLDLVWLWPESEGVRKGVHTLSTALQLMERYPEFRFSMTSPALWEAVQNREPKLISRAQKRIREGRFEITGALWVESDTHMPCGEALARCFILGQQAFRQLTGKYSSVLWLQDTFGYNGVLPQLMALAGVSGMYTTKLWWSPITRFPHNSFVWRGMDGTETIVHQAASMCLELEPQICVYAARNYKQLDVHNEILLQVGVGDGGGGPREESLEREKRQRNLAGLPRGQWGSAEDYFRRLVSHKDRLPVYDGELYLQLHRGCFTSQRSFKLTYRCAERAMQAWEAACVAMDSGTIPNEPWKRICFAQFHDALPGSSIHLVYEQLTPELDKIASQGILAATTMLDAPPKNKAVPGWFNPLGLRRRVVVELPAKEFSENIFVDYQGVTVPVQETKGDPQKRYLASIEFPRMGTNHIALAAENEGQNDNLENITASARKMTNGLIDVDFNAAGWISRICIGHRRIPLIKPCQLFLYPDYACTVGEAWEIERNQLGLGYPLESIGELDVLEEGPVRAVLQGVCKCGEKSTLKVRYIVERGLPWLKIEIQANWQERQKLLRYHVPTGFRATHARYGNPFGSILRPAVPNNAEAEAQWEVPASRWMSLSDDGGGEGVGIVTEASYGFNCRDGNMGISLLRGPTWPDPQADLGEHVLRLALGPSGSNGEAAAVASETLYAALVPAGRYVEPLFDINPSDASLVPAWIMPSKSKGFIIRLHETVGRRGQVKIIFSRKVKNARLADFLENPLEKVPFDSHSVTLNYKPYQILSLHVK